MPADTFCGAKASRIDQGVEPSEILFTLDCKSNLSGRGMVDSGNIGAEEDDVDSEPASEVAGSIELSATFSPKVNLAQQQNSVPFLHELSISNSTGEMVENLVVELSVDPQFCSPKTWHIDRIFSDGSFRVQNVDLALIRPYLAGLREAVRGSAALVAKVVT